MKQLNLRAIKSFYEIIQAGSATAAAERLGLSQPAVSRLIAQLESDVGFALFYREKGRLVPTKEGLRVFEEASIAFSHIERIDTLIRDIRDNATGQLNIVASPSFSEGVISDVIISFLKRYPDVRLNVDSRDAETAKLLVATRAADCGFAKLPVDRPDLNSEKICVSETVCVLPRKHRLAGAESLSPRELDGEPLVLLGRGRWPRVNIEEAFRKARAHLAVKIETHTVGSACAFAARDAGIAIVNELMARTYLRDNLVIRPFRPRIMHEFAFITSSVAPISRLAQAFLEETRRHFRAQ